MLPPKKKPVKKLTGIKAAIDVRKKTGLHYANSQVVKHAPKSELDLPLNAPFVRI